MTQRYMNLNQATEYLGISKCALYELVKKRWIPYGKRGSKLSSDLGGENHRSSMSIGGFFLSMAGQVEETII